MPRKILVIADDPAAAWEYERSLSPDGYAVRFTADPDTGVQAAASGDCDVVLVSLVHTDTDAEALDLLQRLKAADASLRVVILSRHAQVETAVTAMREGAADYLSQTCAAQDLCSALQRIEQASLRREPARGAGSRSETSFAFEGMLGRCPEMHELFALIERIAPADSTVLVTGESGTGKEMVARAIHQLSRRRDSALLACDCTALAPTLLESELFGHVKGSFSGAIATKKGLFEVADRGTLMLDEVSNLSMETQAKLLRLLETRQVRKVGDTTEHEVDIRLIATTNRSLAEMVKEGHFRADLYYRLNVVPLLIPPLRERSGDVPLLATDFLDRFSRQMGMQPGGFSSEAMQQMEVYSWPGNVRELRNIIERLAVLYGDSHIELCHLPVEIREARLSVSRENVPRTWDELKQWKRQTVEDMERRFLIAALDRSSQNVTQAAESVGMQRTNFHALLRIHGLKPDTPRHK